MLISSPWRKEVPGPLPEGFFFAALFFFLFPPFSPPPFPPPLLKTVFGFDLHFCPFTTPLPYPTPPPPSPLPKASAFDPEGVGVGGFEFRLCSIAPRNPSLSPTILGWGVSILKFCKLELYDSCCCEKFGCCRYA